MIEALVEVEIPDGNTMVKTKQRMQVDNSKSKFAAYEIADKILNLYDKFSEKLKAEQREEKKKGSTSRRLFDKREK